MKTFKSASILALLIAVLFATGVAYAEFKQGGSPGGGYYGHSGGGHYGGHGGYYGRHDGGYYGYPGRGYYGGYYRGWGYYPWWRGGIGVYWDPWYYPYYPYYYPYYNPYTVTVPSLPETYIERSQPSEPSAPSGVWYYCPDSKGYYPYVKECPGGWQTLPAQPPSDRRR